MTDTKQITFEGREYTVPVWVEWVARNMDDDVIGYDIEPVISEGEFSGCCMKIVIFSQTKNWRYSLTKV